MNQDEFSSLFKNSLKRPQLLNILLRHSYHMKEDLLFGHPQVAQHIGGGFEEKWESSMIVNSEDK